MPVTESAMDHRESFNDMISEHVSQACVAMSISLLLLMLFLTRAPHDWLQILLSRILHHVQNGNQIPTVDYRWPDGQGDTVKFMHGREYSQIWRMKFGVIYRIWSGFRPEIVLTTPEQVRTVFQKSDTHTKAVNNNSGYLLSQLLGDCLGLISHEEWKRVRDVTKHPFTREASNGYTMSIMSMVRDHLDKVEGLDTFKAGLMNPSKDLKLVPFWVIADILYGRLTVKMKDTLLELIPIRESLFQIAMAGGITRYRWSRFLPSRSNKLLRSFQQHWKSFNEHARATATERGAPQAPVVSYFDAVEGGDCSMSQILQTLDEILFANLDVTLGGLTWNLVQLAAHEDVAKRLQEEIAEVYADSQGEKDDNLIKYLNKTDTYLQCVILESARTRPLAAFTVPQSAPIPHNLNGYHIPAGTDFIVDTRSVNEHPPFWGANATVFAPERFRTIKGAELRYNLWRFGFGPRQCQGQFVADRIIRALLTEVITRYYLTLDADAAWARKEGVWIDQPEMTLRCHKIDSLARRDISASG